MFSGRQYGHGFTLIELLIVVAIIAILAAIAVPNFLEAQTRAKISRVKSDFRSLAVALEAYAADYNHYPISWGINQNVWTPSDVQTLALSLCVLTTPTPYTTTVSMPDPFGWYAPVMRRGDWKTFSYYTYLMLEELVGIDYVREHTFSGITDKSHEYAASVNEFVGYFGIPRKEYDHRAYVLWSAGPDRMIGSAWPDDMAPKQDIGSGRGARGLFFGESARPGDPRFYGPGEIWSNQLYDPTNGTISGGDIWRRGGAIMNTAVPDN